MGAKDAELLFELDQDVEVMRYINGGKITTKREIHEVYLPRLAKYTDAEKGWGMWKVMISQTNQFIGWILVRPVSFFSERPQWDNLELGWRFNRFAWGCGYATEAARHVMHAIADSQGISKFSAIAMPNNEASIRIMKKLGMKFLRSELNKDPLGDIEVVYYELDL